MDTLDALVSEHIPYQHAYALCQEMLTALGIAVAAMWGHVIWLHRSISKRLDKLFEKLCR